MTREGFVLPLMLETFNTALALMRHVPPVLFSLYIFDNKYQI